MAIKDFKDIEGRKGYLVEQEDRKIFQKEISKANFGLGCADMIEFILYDVSDNKLPQGDSGKLVRYIHLDDTNISKYFLISDNILTKKIGDVPEFVVDLEALIKEAGYNNGIFKTQVTLLNRRLGEEILDSNKLWIHEIAPSRTEIRVLPIRAKEENKDLEKRYSVFTEGDTFRDDVIYYIEKFIESFDIEKIITKFLLSKGTESDGKNYINKIKQEFNIENFDIFMYQIERKLIESMKYYANRRVWNINDINYGKPTEEQDCIELSVKKLKQDTITALINSIDFNLPKRTIQDNNVLTKEEQITLDKVKQILKSSTSDNIYDTTVPETEVKGCTDPKALNFNEAATVNDGTCEYRDTIVIKGCTNPKAINYNPKANEDDGSCKFESNTETKMWFIWSDIATFEYKDEFDTLQTINGSEYDSFKIVQKNNSFKIVTGDVREYEKTRPKTTLKKYRITNTDGTDEYGQDIYGTQVNSAFSAQYIDASGEPRDTNLIYRGGSITICAEKDSITHPPNLRVTLIGECDTQTNTGGGSTGGGSGNNSGPLGGGSGGGRDIPNPGDDDVIDREDLDIQNYR